MRLIARLGFSTCGDCFELCSETLDDAGASRQTWLDYERFFSDVGTLRPLTAQEEVDLATRVAHGDLDAKQTLVASNLRLVILIAKNYSVGAPPRRPHPGGHARSFAPWRRSTTATASGWQHMSRRGCARRSPRPRSPTGLSRRPAADHTYKKGAQPPMALARASSDRLSGDCVGCAGCSFACERHCARAAQSQRPQLVAASDLSLPNRAKEPPGRREAEARRHRGRTPRTPLGRPRGRRPERRASRLVRVGTERHRRIGSRRWLPAHGLAQPLDDERRRTRPPEKRRVARSANSSSLLWRTPRVDTRPRAKIARVAFVSQSNFAHLQVNESIWQRVHHLLNITRADSIQ